MSRSPRVVFVENHDSFSWNVVDCLPVPRAAVEVVQAERAVERLEEAEVLIIGPGPTDPLRAHLGSVVQAAARRALPTLGICLGHQALGVTFGAKLVRSLPTHGKTAPIHFGPSRSFPGIEGTLQGMRYHSLSLTELAAPLRAVAQLDDGTIMAIEHESLPMAGLQFHPDSHATPRGRELVAAFFRSVT